jgi:hypothetical protein
LFPLSTQTLRRRKEWGAEIVNKRGNSIREIDWPSTSLTLSANSSEHPMTNARSSLAPLHQTVAQFFERSSAVGRKNWLFAGAD